MIAKHGGLLHRPGHGVAHASSAQLGHTCIGERCDVGVTTQ